MTCTKDVNGNDAGRCQDLDFYGEEDDGTLWFTLKQYADTCCLCGKPYIGASSCSFCQVGTYNDLDTGVATCKKCASGDSPIGTAREEDCVGFCAKGTQFEPISAACMKCPLGKYKNSTANGIDLCSECEEHIPGTTTAETGSESRDDCVCRPGWKIDGAKCKTCDVGKYSATREASDCDDCVHGKQPYTFCKDGKQQGDTLTEKDCSSIINQIQCFGKDDEQCCICGGGVRDYAPTGQSSCSDCLPGTFKASASTSKCSAMDPSCQHANDYDSDCSTCPSGKFSDRSGSSVDKCCAPGKVGDAADCKPCQEGSYQESSESSSCMLCPHAQTSPSGSTAISDCYVSCPAGTYAFNRTLCLDCPTNMNTNAPHSVYSSSKVMIEDCLCSPGFSGAGSGTSKTCTACAHGTYKDAISDAACQNCTTSTSTSNTGATGEQLCVCSPGYGGSGGGSYAQCIACEAGTYKDYTGTGHCKICSAGSFSDAIGQTTCSACLAGKISRDFVSRSGQILNKGKSICESCAPGSFQIQAGATACVDCAPGKYSSSGSSEGQTTDVCTLCEGGKYGEQSGATSASLVCLDCGKGSYSTPGSTRCTQCPGTTFQRSYDFARVNI